MSYNDYDDDKVLVTDEDDSPAYYNGYVSDECKRADELYNARKYAESFAIYKREAENTGNDYAYNAMGRAYLYGYGVAKDYDLAYRYYRIAS